MKKIYLLFAIALMAVVNAQITIYAENFGAGTGSTNTVVTSYTGYQNTTVTYSGTADVRTTTPSTGYTDASGAGCVFLGSTTADPTKMLMIDGINTTNYENMVLSLGHQKGTNASSNELKIEVSADATTWTQLTYTRPTGSGTSTWLLITPSGTIPATASLKIRITNPLNSNVGFRIDDIKLVGTEKALAAQNIKAHQFDVYPTLVSNGIVNVVSKNDVVKNVKIYDQASKLVMNTQTKKEVNVSKLPKGVYILTVEENGKFQTTKFIIK